MTTRPRSLPTNSLVPYFQPTDREYRSESGHSDRYSLRASIATGVHRSSHDDYTTGLSDYATLTEAGHGRETYAPMLNTEVVPTTLGGVIPSPPSIGIMGHPRTEMVSTNGSLFQGKSIPMSADRVVSSSSIHIIGESAAVFTDMTDTMLKVLDQ